MEVLPVNDLDVALHNFVNKDEKLAFYSCVKYNLEETRVSFSIIFCYSARISLILVGWSYSNYMIMNRCVSVLFADKYFSLASTEQNCQGFRCA